MKSWRRWDAVVSSANLWQAWREFEQGKRRRPDVAAFSLDADRHVLRLARELSAGTYRPGPYRLLRITDPKRRLVAAAPVRDRVVHHALHRVLAPLVNRSFIDHSYACLPGRGSHRALLCFLDRVRHFRYVLLLDIRRYFYSIDRNALAELLLPRFREERLRGLLRLLLESGRDSYRAPWVAEWLGWEVPGPPGKGLPIGNLTSQWWGNLYLDGLDHFACRELRVGAYQRYMDDISVFADSRAELETTRDRIGEWLAVERMLELKEPLARPLRTDGHLSYLGYQVTRAGLSLGPKARRRLGERLGAAASAPDRLRATLTSYAAAWRFGSAFGSNARRGSSSDGGAWPAEGAPKRPAAAGRPGR
jgi:hypothetical protein